MICVRVLAGLNPVKNGVLAMAQCWQVADNAAHDDLDGLNDV